MITAVVINPDGRYQAIVTEEVTQHTYAWSTGTDEHTLSEADQIANEWNNLETNVELINGRFHRVCKECDGEGEFETQKDCGKPASICCGGCTQDVICSVCNGSGLEVIDREHVAPHIDVTFKPFEF